MNKSDTHAFVNQLLVYTLVMICLSGSVGLGTVWMRHQISVTANSTRQMQARIAEAERSLAETTIQVAAEESLEVLTRRNAEWKLGLLPPVETQVGRVAGSPERRLAALRNRDAFTDRAGLVAAPVVFPSGSPVRR
ncbi:MAG: hypothetical protein U1F61_25465 [Opitutaceae bacterium]